MFLDDKLEQIYNDGMEEGLPLSVITGKLHKELWSIVTGGEEPKTPTEVQAFLTRVRKVEWSWRLFAKRHKDFKVDGFKELVLESAGDKREVFKRNLKW